ncbi:hypothetical protein ACUY3K_08835 [Corynebacterium uberis]|uniref:hypothetical protein n=1 Tax=Corynebacterium TaxID=1716 RepID=UPI001D0AF387|nr:MULTISPECIES: hypothetical protein [Corynebacterium]MCZ9310135.1 hypothetical protein [Corynebacterium sp. c6VSa_13]UDL73276.1 hypothetical protein LH391_09295 [Corynebacterium uberis]UDL75846.1 hypothetical protein LH393_00095 [Corynebacterium uberis]UDL78059.1 hypothetical protein LH394_00095 [Corynebacterium uberis]UDL80341.1 hypothetical protein LH392_00520 [Corynebacterium uberis]
MENATLNEHWMTHKQVLERRNFISEKLRNLDYLVDEGVPLSRKDLDDLASIGALSVGDRRLYDELCALDFLVED